MSPLPFKELGVRFPIGAKPQEAPTVLATWLDYTCPSSRHAFQKLSEQVVPHYDGRVRWVFFHAPQPWHPQSSLLHEAALAVNRLGGEEAFWAFSTALFQNQTEFFDGGCFRLSREAIYVKLAKLAECACEKFGIKEGDVMSLLSVNEEGHAGNAVTDELKHYVRLVRQQGVTVTPSYAVNWILTGVPSSSWDLARWQEFLDCIVEGGLQAHQPARGQVAA